MKKNNINIKSSYLLFQTETNFYLYDAGNGTVNKISPLIYELINLSDLYNLNDMKEIEKLCIFLKDKYQQEEILKAIELISQSKENGFLEETGKIYNLFERNNAEDKQYGRCLWLNVSHDCNLRCIYCFGNGGDYGQKRMLMSQNTAQKCIDYWFRHIDPEQGIYEVCFFGGEPLMNQETIFFSVSYINQLIHSIGGKVRYNITTNGTIINKKIIQLFYDNQFNVSVSIDGLEKIHNKNRPYASGRGSFAKIAQNIKILSESLPRVTSQITLTKESIPYLIQSVQQLWKLGVKLVYSNLVFKAGEVYSYEDYELYHNQVKELAEITFHNLLSGSPYLYNGLVKMAGKIHRKKFSTNCFMWSGNAFIFSPEGDMHRCYRFIGDNSNKMGNVDNDNQIIREVIKKPKADKCTQCWAQLHCGDGCPYENMIYSNDMNQAAEEWCAKTKILLKEGLILYAKLYYENEDKVKGIFG